MSKESRSNRVSIVGLGLIGGSLALALKNAGWYVTGTDVDEEAVATALERSIIDAEGIDPESNLVFIATPVLQVADQAKRALNVTKCPVTDVGSVKAPISTLMRDYPRFVPGHPMAGNEISKLAGADPSLFVDATWILTPTLETSDLAFTEVHRVLSKVLKAKVRSMEAERHDLLLAAVSHVPHFTAAAIMQTAMSEAGPYESLMMQLAAGGFRDMTRISTGDPDMWVDVSVENRDGIVRVIGKLIETLSHIRQIVADGETMVLRQVLLEAQHSRQNLPIRVTSEYSELAIPVDDRPGVLKEVTNLATDLNVSIFDIDIRHNVEGDKGTLVLMVEDSTAERLFGGLTARNFRPQIRRFGARAKQVRIQAP